MRPPMLLPSKLHRTVRIACEFCSSRASFTVCPSTCFALSLAATSRPVSARDLDEDGDRLAACKSPLFGLQDPRHKNVLEKIRMMSEVVHLLSSTLGIIARESWFSSKSEWQPSNYRNVRTLSPWLGTMTATGITSGTLWKGRVQAYGNLRTDLRARARATDTWSIPLRHRDWCRHRRKDMWRALGRQPAVSQTACRRVVSNEEQGGVTKD